MPYKDKDMQRNAMVSIMRDYRKREKERQTKIEQIIKQTDKQAWEALYATRKRRK